MNILIVAAHPDDEVLGAGGAMAYHAAQGDRVCCVILGSGISARCERPDQAPSEDVDALQADARKAAGILGCTDLRLFDLPDNRMDAIPLLDVVKVVEAVTNEIQPTLVYTHFHGDLNVDHQVTARAVLTACRPLPGSSVKKILAFEVPSATGWGPAECHFAPNVFLDIAPFLAQKLTAMAAYAGELRPYPHARSLEGIEARAKTWGSQVGLVAAEPYMLLRELLP